MFYTVAFLIGMLHIFTFEGSKLVNLNDGAGLTKYGITHKSYPNINISSLTKRQAGMLYHLDYWVPIRADEMYCIMALTLFDSSVNNGKFKAITNLQHILGIPESGVITDALLKKLVTLEKIYAFNEYNQHRVQFYRSCRQFNKFGKGWLKRIPIKEECDREITEQEVFR